MSDEIDSKEGMPTSYGAKQEKVLNFHLNFIHLIDFYMQLFLFLRILTTPLINSK